MDMKPLKWFENRHGRLEGTTGNINKIIPPGISRLTRSFHRQIPGYRISPLKRLERLSIMMGIGGIWVKDESLRLALNSFKVLGGSFAIYRYLKQRLCMDHLELPFSELTSSKIKNRLERITFAAATDGNHGRGVAWAASKLGCESVIYVHKGTALPRIRAIEGYGAEV